MIKNTIFVVITLLLSIPSVWAQGLSPAAQISLMTVEPGTELYSIFGHSAVRVNDPSTNLDRIYNYGTFDFTQPNFYVNFCRGKLLYMLDRETYRSFSSDSRAEGRSYREQVLELTPEQRDRLYQLLQTNALPENREYKYDFFFDNCATRIRDLFRDTYVMPIQWDSTRIPQNATMRHLLRPYLARTPWQQFGIDLVLGMPADRKATVHDAMFLPDHLYSALSKARDHEGKGLVRAEFCSPIFGEPKSPLGWMDRLTSPFAVFCGVALIGLVCMRSQRATRIFDRIFWTLLGLVGVVIAFLWFATDHQATKINLNLFWALPTHLIFAWRTGNKSALNENYFALTTILAGLLTLLWVFLPQELPYEAFPIVVLILIKGLARLRGRE
jgi:Domain of unknown function (DUF4105)